MKKIQIIKNVKESFNKKYISYWDKINEKDFNSKNHVTLKNKNKKFFSESILELEFYVSNKFIGYGKVSSIYDLDYNQLIELSKENGFKIITFDKNFVFENYVTILKKLMYKENLLIIPLENELLVKTDEEFVLVFENEEFFCKNI